MYETDSLPDGWVARCNRLDEIWVPTHWAASRFAAAGVAKSKLFVVGEPVDNAFLAPESRVSALSLPPLPGAANGITPFRFLSIFKWELRKGWDALLAAYFAEFSANEPVELMLKTTPFYSSGDFEGLIADFARERGLPATRAPVRILRDELSVKKLRSLYHTADAFVLPSRGEGWGRPHVEAMAMGLPVIATNWSGPLAFLDGTVGYPLDYTLQDVSPELQLPGHQWAEPSHDHLRRLMRHVFTHQEEAMELGAAARDRMRLHYSPEVFADKVLVHMERIGEKLEARRRRNPNRRKGKQPQPKDQRKDEL